MARVQTPPVLSQIRVARSYSEQATALRALKDEIIGHVQQKERWIEYGILESLVKLLQHNPRASTTLNGKEPHRQRGQPGALFEDEEVRLLSLQLIDSFAYGELVLDSSEEQAVMLINQAVLPSSARCMPPARSRPSCPTLLRSITLRRSC